MSIGRRRASFPLGPPLRSGNAPRDTTPDAHRAQIEIWRAMSPARRVHLAIEMSERAREIAIAGVMAREPAISHEAARLRVFRQILGETLFEAAYGSRGES